MQKLIYDYAGTIVSTMKSSGIKGSLKATKIGYIAEVNGETYHIRKLHFQKDLAQVIDALKFLKMYKEASHAR